MEKVWAMLICALSLFLSVSLQLGQGDVLCTGAAENMTTLCHENASCIAVNNQSVCICKHGFTGNGSSCLSIDDCASSPCPQNSTCVDTKGAYFCTCAGGYYWNGSQCVDECLRRGLECHQHAHCYNDSGSFYCSCVAGYTGNGTFCEKNNNTCTGVHGSCNCTFRVGFAKNENGECADIDECQQKSQVCPQSSVCINTVGTYRCVCRTGLAWNGSECNEIDPCASGGPCHASARCSVVNGTSLCVCKSGFVGNGTHCENHNECDNSTICSSQTDCIDTNGSYLCVCKTGYTGNGTHCFDSNECHRVPRPCHTFEACINTIGSFQCKDQCRKSLCPNLSFCRNLPAGHLCRCNDGLYMSNRLCVRAKAMYRVEGVLLNRTYLTSYADRRSSDFTELAAEMEYRLLRIFRGTLLGSSLQSVQIFDMKRGSVILSYYLLFKEKPALSAAQIADIVKNKSFYLSSSVQGRGKPFVKVTNHCETRSHGCDVLAVCVPTSSKSEYKCKCQKKFEMRNGKCKKKRTYVEVIVPSVIGGLLVLFFASLFVALLCKRRRMRTASKKEAEFYEPHFEVFQVEAGSENHAMQMQETSYKGKERNYR